VPSKSIIPNWLSADLMTVPVRFTGGAAGEVVLGVGVLGRVCDGGSLGDVGSVTLGAPVPLPASFPQPTSKTAHAASTAMTRIEIISSKLRPYSEPSWSGGYVIYR
jgi:hypothetical protein